MVTFTVRRSLPADAPAIEHILLAAFAPAVRPYLSYAQPGIARYLAVLTGRPDLHPRAELLSAVDEQGRVRGFVEYRRTSVDSVVLSWIAVDERLRGLGVGTRLVRHVVAAPGAPARVELDVFESNVAARRLYKRMGFEESGVTRWYARKLAGGYLAGGGLAIRAWHESAACLEVYGFCRVSGTWQGRDVEFGLIGQRKVRVDDPDLYCDDAFLASLQNLFTDRDEALHIGRATNSGVPPGRVVVESARLRADAAVLR